MRKCYAQPPLKYDFGMAQFVDGILAKSHYDKFQLLLAVKAQHPLKSYKCVETARSAMQLDPSRKQYRLQSLLPENLMCARQGCSRRRRKGCKKQYCLPCCKPDSRDACPVHFRNIKVSKANVFSALIETAGESAKVGNSCKSFIETLMLHIICGVGCVFFTSRSTLNLVSLCTFFACPLHPKTAPSHGPRNTYSYTKEKKKSQEGARHHILRE